MPNTREQGNIFPIQSGKRKGELAREGACRDGKISSGFESGEGLGMILRHGKGMFGGEGLWGGR